ncbi:MAG: 7-carboxy-7-deazaguanine synthase QueE [Bacteroidales bacterium]|nr:7-carboxy-7-deazaguanine synthase QueE [Bacteroidales bacterium]
MLNTDNELPLPVMETFFSLQGEGYHMGKAAFFIRLGGCDIGCSWCDTKRGWDADVYPKVSIDELLSRALVLPVRSVVITGGEPMQYDLTMLTRRFKEEGFATFLETSGAHSLSGEWDWICFSPKRQGKPLPEYFERAGELKVIVEGPDDLLWAEENAQKLIHTQCPLFLQPEWSRRLEVTPLVIEYIKKHPVWRLSLQVHKYIKIP